MSHADTTTLKIGDPVAWDRSSYSQRAAVVWLTSKRVTIAYGSPYAYARKTCHVRPESLRRLNEAPDVRALDAPLTELLPLHASDRQLRLLGVACCRAAWNRFPGLASRAAIEAAEAWADDALSSDELRQARRRAYRAKNARPASKTAADLAKPGASDAILFVLSNTYHHCGERTARECLLDVFGNTPFRRPTPPTGPNHRETDVFGNEFHHVEFDPGWLSGPVRSLARAMYTTRDFSSMPILADALEEAGCDATRAIEHCRLAPRHARGCWVVDGILGRG